MSLLQGGAINIAGKRIPLSVLAIVAAVGGGLLLVRQLQANQSNLSVGSPVDLSGSDQPLLDQLNATTQSLQSAVGQLTGTAAAQGVGQPISTPAPTPLGSGQLALVGSSSNPMGIPVYSYDSQHQGILEWLQPDSIESFTGTGFGFSAGEPGYLVDVGGITGFIQGTSVQAVGGAPAAPVPARTGGGLLRYVPPVPWMPSSNSVLAAAQGTGNPIH